MQYLNRKGRQEAPYWQKSNKQRRSVASASTPKSNSVAVAVAIPLDLMPRHYDPQPLASSSSSSPLISDDEVSNDYDSCTATLMENRRLLNGKRISISIWPEGIHINKTIFPFVIQEGEAFDAVPTDKRQIGLCCPLNLNCLIVMCLVQPLDLRASALVNQFFLLPLHSPVSVRDAVS